MNTEEAKDIVAVFAGVIIGLAAGWAIWNKDTEQRSRAPSLCAHRGLVQIHPHERLRVVPANQWTSGEEIESMTNTIVLLSVLLQTNWVDTTVVHDGLQVQIGRVQTNYVVRPALGPVVIPRGFDFRTYPILTSQPFFGPYNLIREVPQKYITVGTNQGAWDWVIPRGIIFTNTHSFPPGL